MGDQDACEELVQAQLEFSQRVLEIGFCDERDAISITAAKDAAYAAMRALRCHDRCRRGYGPPVSAAVGRK